LRFLIFLLWWGWPVVAAIEADELAGNLMDVPILLRVPLATRGTLVLAETLTEGVDFTLVGGDDAHWVVLSLKMEYSRMLVE
jgi:hypothetical protein